MKLSTMSNQMLEAFPQGDPYSGPAYGDKEKSKGLGMVIGVVASIATMGAAAPMLASGVMASQIAGGAMMAGGVLSGVGAITGNKKLTKIGGVLGLAGGIGGWAAGAMGAGQAGSTGMLAAGSGSKAISSMSTSFMESVNGMGLGNLYSPESIAAGKAGTAAAGGTTPIAADAGGSTLELATAPLGSEGPMTDASMDTLNLADGGMDSNMRAVQGNAAAGVKLPAVTPAASAGGAASEKGIFGKALGFVKDNPEVTKIGAGMLSQAMESSAQEESVQVMNDKYAADTNLLKTQNEIAQYKLANAGKQVVMIPADDADKETKIATAKAAGIPFAFIPAIGAGYTPMSKNFTPVARNATYNQPTPTAA